MAQKRVFVTGVSGTGKSALVRTLQEEGIKALDADEVSGLARWVSVATGMPADWKPGSSAEWHRQNRWLIDRVRLEDLLEREQPQVLAGLAANQTEITGLFTATVLLRCPPDVFLGRVELRADNRYGKDPAERAVILSTHEGIEGAIIGKGAVVLDADRPIGQVAHDVMQLLGPPHGACGS